MDIRYDDICSHLRGTGKLCKVRFTPKTALVSPVVYYRLDKFYSNYRSYVKSKDNYQLRGKEKTLKETTKCAASKSYADLLTNDWLEVSELTPFIKNNVDELAFPCGQIAKYYFTDQFLNVTSVDKIYSERINDENIEMEVDNLKFKMNDAVAERG